MIKRVLGALAAGTALVGALTLNAAAESRFVPGVVNADGGLNARIAPSPHTDVRQVLPDGAEVSIDCKVNGGGDGGSIWYLLAGEGDARWASADYIETTGAEPGWCGDGPIEATVLADSTTHLGPAEADETYREVKTGARERVNCYAYTAAGGNDPWVVTTEGDWLPGGALQTEVEVPFCQG